MHARALHISWLRPTGWAQVLLPLVTGGCLVIAKPDGHTDPGYIAALVRQQRVSWFFTVPALGALYIHALREELCESLRMVVLAGG